MLTHSYANFWFHFYPFGNTTAVLLTQNLAPDHQQADILLLGCGDVRNILFSVHSDPGRKMDITCCDIESATIARNILLLTLILDDKDGQKNEENWDIYYHLHLSNNCIGRLRAQATKLQNCSTSLNTWRGSEYGKLMTFCDEGTLSRVNKMWSFYVESSRDILQGSQNLRARLDKVQEARTRKIGSSIVLNSIRSASPLSVLAMHDHLPKKDPHSHFWKRGSTYIDSKKLEEAKHPNPMVLSPDPAVMIQYGSDPFPGFHLSAAYASLQTKSPLAHDDRRISQYGKVAAAARVEFSAWSDSFRQHARNNVTLRFCVADAFAFSHTLQSCQGGLGDTSWYRKRNGTFDVLKLVQDDYCSGGPAPTAFDVIDTSNLVDHVGALNILVATSPLLRKNASSCLFTEVLVHQGTPDEHIMNNLVCGHLPSIALLLGLSPVEYWTNTSPTSECDQQLVGQIGSKLEASDPGQLPTRIMWKNLYWQTGARANLALFRMEGEDLAKILFQVYQEMFPAENVEKLMGNAGLNAYRTGQDLDLPTNTRACFVAFLKLVKSNVVVSDWESVMTNFQGSIGRISGGMIASTAELYLHELYAYLHLYDVFSGTLLEVPHSQGSSFGDTRKPSMEYLHKMPPVVCVTLRVPREALQVLIDEDPNIVGTVPVHCSVDQAGIFAVLQTGLGEMTTTGSRDSNQFQIHIKDDEQGWYGKSDLFVSFFIPTRILIQQPAATRLDFAARMTRQTMLKLVPTLGFGLVLFGTSFNDHKHVFITQHLPNFTGPVRLAGNLNQINDVSQSIAQDDAVKTTITASVSPQPTTVRLSTFTARVDILNLKLRKALQGGSQVQVTLLHHDPSALSIAVGKEPPFKVSFPAPIINASVKTRIARKSSWIELIANMVTDPASAPLPSFTFPMLVSPSADAGDRALKINLPITPYIHLSTLPILDISSATADSFQWLNIHTTFMFSPRERQLRENPSLPVPPSSTAQRTVVEFKDSLFSMFMQFPGIQGTKHNIFGITNPSNGGVHILFFVSSFRLDLASRSVVLDAAVLPLFDQLMPRLGNFLQAFTASRFINIKVNDAELEMWKEMLPAMAERCREGWTHKTAAGACGYSKAMKAPISTTIGEECICRCGNGQFPKGFRVKGVPMWDTIKGFCTRVAISPLFCNPLVERVVPNLSEFMGRSTPHTTNQGPRAAGARASGGEATEPNRDTGVQGASGKTAAASGCEKCGDKISKNGQELKACAKCRSVRYCSRECQKADWKAHKKNCGSTSS
ncbi:hypothetical protein QBC43DRAFT_38684 [Cladorrhinum sp. PSN259]|nr:hypothetical protein QBC43DRAFT_38684 [Cladorrhinum sp. PSN259]